MRESTPSTGRTKRSEGSSSERSSVTPKRRKQTLGNISTDPCVGLLFVEFDSGTTLPLTERARILWDREDFHELAGAERAVEAEIDGVVDIAGRGPLGWRFVGYSRFNSG